MMTSERLAAASSQIAARPDAPSRRWRHLDPELVGDHDRPVEHLLRPPRSSFNVASSGRFIGTSMT
jgi:hypothetical protein